MELTTVFNCFIAGGFVIPVLNVAVGAIGGALDLGGGDLDVDTDFDLDADLDLDVDADFDLDADLDVDADVDLDADLDVGADAPAGHGKLPVNLMTLSLSAVVFGALGRLFLGFLPPVWAVVLALQLGVLAGFLLGWFVIRPLKRNRAYAANIRALRGRTAEVALEARSDFTGTIRALSATGSLVSYDARPVEGVERLPIGAKVRIVDVDPEKNLCWVKPLEPEAD